MAKIQPINSKQEILVPDSVAELLQGYTWYLNEDGKPETFIHYRGAYPITLEEYLAREEINPGTIEFDTIPATVREIDGKYYSEMLYRKMFGVLKKRKLS